MAFGPPTGADPVREPASPEPLPDYVATVRCPWCSANSGFLETDGTEWWVTRSPYHWVTWSGQKVLLWRGMQWCSDYEHPWVLDDDKVRRALQRHRASQPESHRQRNVRATRVVDDDQYRTASWRGPVGRRDIECI